MLTPRAANDFEIIRGRLEELRRERAQASRQVRQPAVAPEADSAATSDKPVTRERRLPRAVRQRLFG